MVSLAGCAVGGSIRPLAHVLATAPLLRQLELADNALGDAGCTELVRHHCDHHCDHHKSPHRAACGQVHALSTVGCSRWCLAMLGRASPWAASLLIC